MISHSEIVAAATGRQDCVLLLANYLDSWQLSLDGNLLGTERRARQEEAQKWAEQIVQRIRLAVA